MPNIVLASAALIRIEQAVIDGLLEIAGPAHTTVKLAISPFAPTANSVPGDFTEATFDGYVAKTVPGWEPPYLVSGGSAETISTGVLHWAPTGTVVSNVILGYWIEDANGDYLGAQVFDAPIPMGDPTNAINLVPRMQVPPADWESTLIV